MHIYVYFCVPVCYLRHPIGVQEEDATVDSVLVGWMYVGFSGGDTVDTSGL